MTSIRRIVERAIPGALWRSLQIVVWKKRLIGCFLYDYRRYSRWSFSVSANHSLQNRLAHITKEYHRLEKGLALPEPRSGFGAPIARDLIRKIDECLDLSSSSSLLPAAVGALQAYCEFNERQGALDEGIAEGVRALSRRVEECEVSPGEAGGTLRRTREAIHERSIVDLEPLFTSRHSVRNFSPEPVDRALIQRAVLLAQRSPSVCNRQCARVHAYFSSEAKRRALSFQGGNRGFGDRAGAVLVVCAEVGVFASVGERNQAWVDGGLFSMSLVYALHSFGLGTCCLNFCVEPATERGLKESMGIPESERVVMLIAVGHLPDEFLVANSHRIPVTEVLELEGQ